VTSAVPKTKAVILAAGLGTRMKSRVPKVLHPICGRPMLAYVIDAAREATGERPLVVYSPATELVRETFKDEADFALQEQPHGTGDAVRAGIAALGDDVDEVVVLSGDVPLIDLEAVRMVAEKRRERGAAMTLAVIDQAGPYAHAYGRIQIEPGDVVTRIVEAKDAPGPRTHLEPVNGGLYAFDLGWLRSAVARIQPSAATGELYLTQTVEIAVQDGVKAVAVREPSLNAWWDTFVGVNDRADLTYVTRHMQQMITNSLMKGGVTFLDPQTVIADATVELESDVTVEPNVVLRGATRVGRDTIIRSGSQLFDAVIGERCLIWSSVIESSQVGNDVRIGPFAHLRSGCVVGDSAEIGNYAEQKNTRFGARSKQHHFSYLGDAEIGEDVNIGAGTITANYDGKQKHRTVIGNGAFVGSDTILRAPVTVGEGAYTGAGSVVTKDVPPGKLAVGVPARIRERIVKAAPEAAAETPAQVASEASAGET